MEILNVIEGKNGEIGVGVFLGILSLVLLFFTIVLLMEKSVIALLPLFATVMFAIASYISFTEESPDKYEVLITDFNEVYEQGYEIVDQRGDIYTVQKKEDE